MKIKTIWTTKLVKFDDDVNNAMAEGYKLIRRDVFTTPEDLDKSVLYAELVLLDPPAEPDPIDPFQALRQVQEFCRSIPVEKCNADGCPLRYWCAALEGGGDPTDWDLPEVED